VTRAATTFQQFADGLAMPRAAREALGLTPDTPTLAAVGKQLPAGHVPEVGLIYPDTPTEAAENVTKLWRSDLSDTAMPWGQIDPGAWNNASLRWLVDPGHDLDSGMPGGVRIGITDVDRFRATTEMFTRLDDRYGGGHASCPRR
jgi:hypothetical protein